MRVLWVLFLCLTLSIASIAQFPAVYTESSSQSFEHFGPRVNNVLFNTSFANQSQLLEAFESGQLDFIDTALPTLPQSTIDKWSNAPYNETIGLKKFFTDTMYELDINNNETIATYPNWRSPTSYAQFRHAIAHLVSKSRIITEILKGYGLEMSTPVFSWLTEWFNPAAGTHPYNPEEAAAILDAAGFVQGSTPNPYYNSSKLGSAQFIRIYPSGHQKSGENLDNLIFYPRFGDTKRMGVAQIIQDELQSIGIPVTLSGPIRTQELIDKIWQYHDFHLYTGGWLLSSLPNYLYNLYHSSFYYPDSGFYSVFGGSNYNHVNDTELDYWLEMLPNALNYEIARTACLNAQRRLAEIVGIVPLWCPAEVKAYRKVSERAPTGWKGIVNQNNLGVDCSWTFLDIHKNGTEEDGSVYYGYDPQGQVYTLCYSPLGQNWPIESLVLSNVYDCLLNRNPNSLELMPWLAESYEVGKWFDRQHYVNCTRFVFHLRNDVFWHDGTPFTSADVKFTIDYLLQFKSWWFPPSSYDFVNTVNFVEAPDSFTVIVYMNLQNYWTIYNFANLFIIPKHIWQNKPIIPRSPLPSDPNLIGTGPFKLVPPLSNSGVLLEKNNNYFLYCPVQTDIKTNSYKLKLNETLEFNVTVKNCFSDKIVNTTATIYFDDIVLQNVTLSLQPFSQIKLGSFTIADVERGKHEIRVEHTPESYLNRTCVAYKYVWCTIKEDVNLDFRADMDDIYIAARAFGSYPGHQRWNCIVDINNDFRVDMSDIYDICRTFGKY